MYLHPKLGQLKFVKEKQGERERERERESENGWNAEGRYISYFIAYNIIIWVQLKCKSKGSLATPKFNQYLTLILY